MARLVVCETVAAITTHLRKLSDGEEPLYSGHRRPQPRTLCDAAVGWDTHIPLEAVRCRRCIEACELLEDGND